MPGETPDWGALSAQATVFPVTDLGELAARLGSIVTHDRGGDVVFFDDFEAGITSYAVGESGTGADVSVSTVRRRSGLYSVGLTAGSDGGAQAILQRRLPFPVLGRFGFESHFSIASDVDNIQWRFSVNDGTDVRLNAIIYDSVNDRLEYVNSAGAEITFATGIDLLAHASLFHALKMVVDLSDGTYQRVILNNTAYTLASPAGTSNLSAISPHISVEVRNNGRAGGNDVVYTDDWIITQNEGA